MLLSACKLPMGTGVGHVEPRAACTVEVSSPMSLCAPHPAAPANAGPATNPRFVLKSMVFVPFDSGVPPNCGANLTRRFDRTPPLGAPPGGAVAREHDFRPRLF